MVVQRANLSEIIPRRLVSGNIIVFNIHSQGHIQNPLEYLRSSFLQKYLTAESREQLLQKVPS